MTAVTTARPAGSYLADTATLIGRSIRLTRRDADTLLMAIVLPVMLMLLFVFVFGGAITTGTEYVTYVVPGIILLCVGYGASTTAMSVAKDMHEGMIDRLQTLPIRSSSVLTGHVVASVARNALAAVVVFAVAFACGFRPTASAAEWVAAARAAAALRARPVLAGRRARTAGRQCRIRRHHELLHALPALPEQRVRAHRHDARRCCERSANTSR